MTPRRGPLPGITSSILKTKAGQISFFETGTSSELPALVVLPGYLCSAHRLLTALLPLALQTRLIAVEWRGHGNSFAAHGFSLGDLAEDVLAVINLRLKDSRLCFMAHSMGARVLWELMDSRHASKFSMVEGIAILDQGPAPSATTPHEEAAYKHHSDFLGSGKTQMISTLRKIWENERGFVQSKEEFEQWLEFAGECDPAAASSLLWESVISDYTQAAQWVSSSIQVLLMAGDSTIAAKGSYQRLLQAIPPHGAHFANFVGGNHCLFQQPEQVPQLLHLLRQLLQRTLEINITTPAIDNSKFSLGTSTTSQGGGRMVPASEVRRSMPESSTYLMHRQLSESSDQSGDCQQGIAGTTSGFMHRKMSESSVQACNARMSPGLIHGRRLDSSAQTCNAQMSPGIMHRGKSESCVQNGIAQMSPGLQRGMSESTVQSGNCQIGIVQKTKLPLHPAATSSRQPSFAKMCTPASSAARSGWSRRKSCRKRALSLSDNT
jgi:pimeloyl-ACP methyl ester carboxylesterase